MTWTIYLLSVLDGIREAASGLVVFATIAAIFFTLATIINGDDLLERGVRLPIRTTVVVFAISMCVLAFVPSTDTLLRAYVMVEGGKIANAENVEAVAKLLAAKLGLTESE